MGGIPFPRNGAWGGGGYGGRGAGGSTDAQAEQAWTCPTCGSNWTAEQTVCPYDGQSATSASQANAPRNRRQRRSNPRPHYLAIYHPPGSISMQAYVLRARLPQLQRPVGRPIGNLLIGVSCTGLLMYEMVRWGIGALIFLLWVAVLGVALMLIIYLAGRVASTARVRRALQRLLLPLARRAGSLVTRVLAFLDMSPTRPVSLYQVERVADREVVGVEILNQNRQPLLLAAHRDAVVYFIGYEREEQGILTFDALLAVPVDSQGYLLGMPIVSVRPLHWGWGMVSIVVAVLLATVI